MNEYTFRVKMRKIYSNGFEDTVYYRTIRETSKSLSGAARKVYQNYPNLIEIVRIVTEFEDPIYG